MTRTRTSLSFAGVSPKGDRRVAARRVATATLAIALAVTGGANAAGPARGQPAPPSPKDRVLLDRELNESVVQVVRIDEAGVWCRLAREPASTVPRLRPAAELVAMTSPPSMAPARRAASDPRPLLTAVLTDGQRVIGRVPQAEGAEPAPAKDAPLSLETALGVVRLPLDVVGTIGVGRAPPSAPEPPRSDVVTLANGDLVTGFVESVGQTVTVQPEGTAAVTLPLERVAGIELANPREAPAGTRVWLADGSVLAVSGLAQSAGALPTAQVAVLESAATTTLAHLEAVVFDASRLVGLGRLAPPAFVPSADRRWTRPPRVDQAAAPLDTPDVHIPGPMTVEWDLPETAARLAGDAELARFTDGWGECTVTIEVVPASGPATRLWSQRLEVSSAAGRFSVSLGAPAPGRRLRVIIESGQRGPIQDHVVLKRPLLLLGRR